MFWTGPSQLSPFTLGLQEVKPHVAKSTPVLPTLSCPLPLNLAIFRPQAILKKKKKNLIYLAAPGLSCGTPDL